MRLSRAIVFAALTILILMGAFSAASLAHAENLQWQTQLNAITYDVTGYGSDYAPHGSGSLYAACVARTMRATLRPTVQVNYSVQVTNVDTGEILACGSTQSVPRGTTLRYQFIPHVSSDLHWFAGTAQSQGLNIDSSYESHYGQWSSAPSGPASCPASTIWDNADTFITNMYVTPPTKNFSGIETFSCSGSSTDQSCTMTTRGTFAPTFNIGATSGVFHMTRNSGRCPGSLENHTGIPGGCIALGNVASFTVPVQTIACPITVTALPENENPEEHTPSTPSLTSGGACVVGTPHSISFVSTDPDGDNVRYGIDWDADGSVNEWVPPSGYVASGASQSASRTYSTTGSKTVKVMAEDDGGLTSPFATLTFSCTQTPPPAGQCSDNADNDGDGLKDSLDPDCTATAGLSEFAQGQASQSPPDSLAAILDLRVIPSLVHKSNTTKLNWSATNVTSCTVQGENGDSWTALQSPVGGQTSRPITEETTYTLACIDSTGLTVTRTATVRILPSWEEL